MDLSVALWILGESNGNDVDWRADSRGKQGYQTCQRKKTARFSFVAWHSLIACVAARQHDRCLMGRLPGIFDEHRRPLLRRWLRSDQRNSTIVINYVGHPERSPTPSVVCRTLVLGKLGRGDGPSCCHLIPVLLPPLTPHHEDVMGHQPAIRGGLGRWKLKGRGCGP